MLLENFITKLQKVKGSSIGRKIDEQEILKIEEELNIKFPNQIKNFYKACNGIQVLEPNLVVLPIEKLTFIDRNKLLFATVGKSKELYFDTKKLNVAEQWSIKTLGTDYQVTFTMASFWTNKVWRWLNYQKPIWEDEHS